MQQRVAGVTVIGGLPQGSWPACRYVTREDDKDSDAEAADDGKSDGEELLDIDWDTQAVSADFDLMNLKTASGRCACCAASDFGPACSDDFQRSGQHPYKHVNMSCKSQMSVTLMKDAMRCSNSQS
jgi:hypothetical protein